MRWLWKGWPEAVKAGRTQNDTLDALLISGEGWQLVSDGYKFAEGSEANANASV